MTNTTKQTKKEIIIQETTNDGNNDAIFYIKKSIKSFKESYQKFIAGGAYLFLHDANAKEGLREIVKKEYASKEDWAQVERQYRRRIAHAEKLATYYIFALDKMTVEEIFKFIKKEKITSAHLEELGKTPEDVNETEEPETEDANETEEPETEEPETEEKEMPLQALIKRLETLTASESEKVARYFLPRGKTFIFRNSTEEEKKQVANLYQ